MADADHEAHKTIAWFENFWIAFSVVLLVVFVTLVFHAVSMHGGQIGKAESRQPVEDVLAMPEFAEPAVRAGENGGVVASVVARAFSFEPNVIEVPAGTPVTFRMTSTDVIHGFQIKGTNVNVELIPGEIAQLQYTFREPGDYPLICNQYCGAAHHNMINTVRVVDADAFQLAEADPDDEAEADDALAWEVRGERIYGNQCAACHQADGSGMGSAFPPLAGHAVDLMLADGGRDYLIDVVLYGLAGPIDVDGVRFSGQMPGFARLADEDVAAVVNYMSLAWGQAEQVPDDFEPVQADEVAERRDRGLAPRDVLDLRPALD